MLPKKARLSLHCITCTLPSQRIVLLSVLGPVGAVLEVVLILYLIAASLLGCYSLPVVARIKPRRGDTPMVHVIANCAIVLILSCALPLLARTLGEYVYGMWD